MYRKRHKGLPDAGARGAYDWTTQQVTILRDAGELELMDELLAQYSPKRNGHVPAEPAAAPGAVQLDETRNRSPGIATG